MQAARFQAAGCDKTLWSVSGDRLYFGARLWPFVEFDGLEVRVSYFEARILSSMTYRNFFVPVSLNRDKQVVVEKMRASLELTLSGEDRVFFETQLVHDERKIATDRIHGSDGSEILNFESVVSGLQAYF